MADKNEILNQIVSVLEEPLATHGFKYRRKGMFECIIPDTHMQQEYIISLSKAKGYFHLHIRLAVRNSALLKEFDILYKKTLLYTYRNFEEEFRDKCVKRLSKMKYYSLLGLTDWRELKYENESLDDFNNRFNIWFCVFDELDELNHKKGETVYTWQEQLLTSINLCLKFFKKAEDRNFIIDRTMYQGLFLLKQDGKIEDIQNKYNSFLEKEKRYKNNTEQIEYFYNLLMS